MMVQLAISHRWSRWDMVTNRRQAFTGTTVDLKFTYADTLFVMDGNIVYFGRKTEVFVGLTHYIYVYIYIYIYIFCVMLRAFVLLEIETIMEKLTQKHC